MKYNVNWYGFIWNEKVRMFFLNRQQRLTWNTLTTFYTKSIILFNCFFWQMLFIFLASQGISASLFQTGAFYDGIG